MRTVEPLSADNQGQESQSEELAKFDPKTQTDEATKIVYTVGQTVPGKRQLPGRGAVCDVRRDTSSTGFISQAFLKNSEVHPAS